VEAIAKGLGPFAATLLVPAFLEGGRTTVAGVHRLDGRPVHETAFGRDRLFGFGSSYLPQWVEEKTGGRVAADQVQRLDLELMEAAAVAQEQGEGPGMERLQARLADLGGGMVVAVDAERPGQLAALGTAIRQLTLAGPPGPSPWLLQSAASVLGPLAALPPQPLAPPELAGLRRRGPAGPLPGLVLVGSHVPLADAQLARLLEQPGCALVELPVVRIQRLLEGPLPDRLLASLEAEWLQQLRQVLAAGRTPVLATSRGELCCRHAAERRALGLALAGLMARLAAALAPELGYIISKGGITSHTLLAEGLGLARVELQGQIAPGLSLVLTPPGAAVAELPLVTFPGNLGDGEGLVAAWRLMEGG
ncbi:MAG: four-carbon acid sugar kinase family protein, partial [Synechococcaceae cyanobacterium]